MAVKTIVSHPNPKIREKSLPVEKFDDEFREIIKDALDTLYAEEAGVGIALIQIGIPLRTFIVDIPLDETGTKRKPYIFVNPEITKVSKETVVLDESCFSVGDEEVSKLEHVRVERPLSVGIKYQDAYGKEQNIYIDGNESDYHLWFARCAQHEFDHLEGILFIDKLAA